MLSFKNNVLFDIVEVNIKIIGICIDEERKKN